MTTISWNDFKKIEIRIGTIIEAIDFPEAEKPAYKLKVDLGKEIGIKQSSAQITELYSKKDLLNKQVVVVVNFTPKQIGPFISECLVTGFYNNDNQVILAVPDRTIQNGSRLS
tara:strand:- start:743 stop:1081 length:339 start_codon:yes stop_codon:yes gene_type:complete